MSEDEWKKTPNSSGFWWRGVPGEIAELVWVEYFASMDAFSIRSVLWGGEAETYRPGPKGHHLLTDARKLLNYKWWWKKLSGEMVPEK